MTENGDLAARMVAGIYKYLDAELERVTAERRQQQWQAGPSIEEKRKRLLKVIGLVDARVPNVEVIFDAAMNRPSLVARTSRYKIHVVRWPVLPDLDAAGLLLEPARHAVASVVALPDADWSPEQIVGLAPGAVPYARMLAEQGCRVLIPVLIDRKDTWSGSRRFRFTNQPHREFIHRMAYQMGRHIIGYEVQKVLAAVDWFTKTAPNLPVAVAGYGEGGLIAFYSAAADPRIRATLVSGYFQSRENVWNEPLYRIVWSLLNEFGDADLAGLIAPRSLIIEASRGPQVTGPPPETPKRRGAAPGILHGPELPAVQREFHRAQDIYRQLHAKDHHLALITPPDQKPGSPEALQALLRALGHTSKTPSTTHPQDSRKNFDPTLRMRRQFEQMVEYTQSLVRSSEVRRQQFWSKADLRTLPKQQDTLDRYRDYYWKEVIGKLPNPSEPLVPQVREVQGTAKWKRYDVVLPVWPAVFAYGVLLLPKDMNPGERRPVVVCQHGLNGKPDDVILPANERAARVYGNFAAKLADQGFVVFAPQLPYIGEFREIYKKASPLKLSLYSFILGQNQRILEWLAAQPFVDAKRIGFYGLSYGGKTAMRVPSLLKQYTLSICSGDFNEWIWKTTTLDFTGSYMFTHEYEILEFDTGNTFNYAELAYLMGGRPFMVERGHRDGVGIDEQVAYEYAKVRRFYDEAGIGERTTIEYFNGPHEIHGVGTFDFLRRFLRWPAQ